VRTIRYSERWEQCLKAVGPLAERLEEILMGVEWAVAENAEDYGDEVPGTNLLIALTDPFPGAPALVVFYSIEDEDYAVMEWFEIDETYPDEEAEAEDEDGD